jgi:hypothetical protein
MYRQVTIRGMHYGDCNVAFHLKNEGIVETVDLTKHYLNKIDYDITITAVMRPENMQRYLEAMGVSDKPVIYK